MFYCYHEMQPRMGNFEISLNDMFKSFSEAEQYAQSVLDETFVSYAVHIADGDLDEDNDATIVASFFN